MREDFLASPDRPAVHAGLLLCEKSPRICKRRSRASSPAPDGPGTTEPTSPQGRAGGDSSHPTSPIRRRGAAAYAHAYGHLKDRTTPPELVIILGTSRITARGRKLFSATKKVTRLHSVRCKTDVDFVNRLASHYCGDLFADELLHRNEHSIEFQALFLKWALGNHDFTRRRRSSSARFTKWSCAARMPGSDPPSRIIRRGRSREYACGRKAPHTDCRGGGLRPHRTQVR